MDVDTLLDHILKFALELLILVGLHLELLLEISDFISRNFLKLQYLLFEAGRFLLDKPVFGLFIF